MERPFFPSPSWYLNHYVCFFHFFMIRATLYLPKVTPATLSSFLKRFVVFESVEAAVDKIWPKALFWWWLLLTFWASVVFCWYSAWNVYHLLARLGVYERQSTNISHSTQSQWVDRLVAKPQGIAKAQKSLRGLCFFLGWCTLAVGLITYVWIDYGWKIFNSKEVRTIALHSFHQNV